VNYPTLLAQGLRRSLLKGSVRPEVSRTMRTGASRPWDDGASCFHEALCGYGCIHRKRSLQRYNFEQQARYKATWSQIPCETVESPYNSRSCSYWGLRGYRKGDGSGV